MATAVQMQPHTHASMDRSTSFDQPRSRSTPPFASQHHPSISYDQHRPVSNVSARQSHTRSSSNTSVNSPYNQPFAHQYFPQPPTTYNSGMTTHQQQAWTTTPIPATAFYPSPMQLHPGQSFQQNFQQSQADFAAWAAAYHQMVAASMAQGENHMTHAMPPRPEYLSERRRTNSNPGSASSYPTGAFEQQEASSQSQSRSVFKEQRVEYTRPRTLSQHSSRENVRNGLSRSTSQPSLSSNDSRHSDSSPYVGHSQDNHRRATSLESNGPKASVQPPRIPSRQESYESGSGNVSSDRSTPQTSTSPAASVRIIPAMSASKSLAANVADRPRAPQPLHTGPIANATNTPNPASRPSPLSQAATNVEPEKVKSGGLKGRLRRVLDKEASTPKKQSTTPSMVSNGTMRQPTFPSPSESSTRSTTPPVTPPQSNDLQPPSRPFVVHPQGMGSDVSLAETDRTATAPIGLNDTAKSKKSLFRMKNMSTDNISLSSTVSSASMMIRKMGSIGKIARRNSLMGISRIFKDRPKDEDAALPEKEAKKKKKKEKKDKKDKGKSEVSPAVVSHAVAETDRVSEDDDRALAGLSPAAKLARQHTLRSKAEQERRRRESGNTGEPAWDNNTTTRTNHVLPSIGSVAGRRGSAPEVVHITPGRTSTVVRAVQVSEQEYDSEDDSSDGETVEDVTHQLARARMSDCSSAADAEFRDTWGNVWIDRNAVPKKGILKNKVSMENLAARAARQRSSSTAEVPHSSPSPSPMNQPRADADQIDGIHHPLTTSANEAKCDPTSVAFAPFESPEEKPELTFPYSTASHNTSAPALSLITHGKPLTVRSMTAPSSRRLIWAPECAVYSTYDPMTYDRRSEPATCNRLTPELAQEIKSELNAFKLEMPIHPESRSHTHFFA